MNTYIIIIFSAICLLIIASVVRNQKAPLLRGQSVLGRVGSIEIDNPGKKLIITYKR